MSKEYTKNVYQYLLLLNSGFINWKYYIETYPAIHKKDINPLWHYKRYGWKENRNSSNMFKTRDYLTLYPDIQEAGINYSSQNGKIFLKFVLSKVG